MSALDPKRITDIVWEGEDGDSLSILGTHDLAEAYKLSRDYLADVYGHGDLATAEAALDVDGWFFDAEAFMTSAEKEWISPRTIRKWEATETGWVTHRYWAPGRIPLMVVSA